MKVKERIMREGNNARFVCITIGVAKRGCAGTKGYTEVG